MGPVRAVAAMPYRDEIGLTLVQDNDGWHFSHWHRHLFSRAPLPPLPSADDQRRRFETSDAARDYFAQFARAVSPAEAFEV
jgi:hypothetical protein